MGIVESLIKEIEESKSHPDHVIAIGYSENEMNDIMKDKIIHSSGDGFYVSKIKNLYHVWEPSVTHAIADSAYEDLSCAIARCDYLAKNYKS